MLLLALAASLGWGCVDVTPPWQKTGWSNRDSDTSAKPDAALPPPADGEVIKTDTGQGIPPEPSIDANRDERQDTPDDSDAGEDARPLTPDAQTDGARTQDGRPDGGTKDTRGTDGGDAFVKMDRAPDLDTAKSDAPDADLATDVTTPSSDTRPDALPTQGLVAYYPCESANAAVLPDESGNSKNATLANGSGGTPTGFTFAAGKVGNGVRLNSTDKAFLGLPKGIVSGLSQVTIATWVKMNAGTAFQRIFDFGMDTSTFMYLTNFASSGVRFRISHSSGKNQIVETSTALAVGTWTHVTLTLGDDGISIFVDGNQVAQQAPAVLRASDLGDTERNAIGRSQFAADPYFDGSIDDFRIYDRVLSASEIKNLANGQ